MQVQNIDKAIDYNKFNKILYNSKNPNRGLKNTTGVSTVALKEYKKKFIKTALGKNNVVEEKEDLYIFKEKNKKIMKKID